ncbi:ORF6N domain-containing protein [Clostridium sp. BJN0013]|uniref:ORF6N domain-containing protein n=1 Tax=Clostridium sp. BJN0013 TaxID=3236840 RepID=UPI0034C62DB7
MSNIMPMEFKNQRIMTTKVLAEQYGTNEQNISKNFTRNSERFVEGKHYFKLEGEELKEFKGYVLNDESLKFVSILYLWTDRGAARHAKILDTDEAWDIYEELEETYFRVKESKPTCIEDVLIQSLQEMKDMRLQIEEAKKQTIEVKEEVQDIRNVITLNPQAAWRRECNRILNAIGRELGDYKAPKDQVYEALKVRGKCRPNVLIVNLKKRAKENGMAPSKIEKLNILDVLENEPRLKEIYVTIVKEMAIKNGVRIREEVAI